ncbi:uncharacterized protein arhgef49 [Scleropages formosus]|uniref:uncharacterized protein arhgef49 n=1 Tax=Scleropages formosus TaxID=113540 RepID=UPI0010FA7496|nr:uncharacterized protein LOC108928346 [Scleropages formosus]
MPDVRDVSCDDSAVDCHAGGVVHLEPCLPELQEAPPEIPGCRSVARGNRCPVAPGCQGLDSRPADGTSRVRSATRPGWAETCGHCAQEDVPSARLFRSMENLHLSALSDAGLHTFGATCRSVDSELAFHCAAASAGSPEASNPLRVPLRRDRPLLPQGLFPVADERTASGSTWKGVRERLRSQSARAIEPNRPLKPRGTAAKAAPTWGPRGGERAHTCPAGCRLARGPRLLSTRPITSPEEIKQEVMRRLQLRRQRSSPNLALPSTDPPDGLYSHCKPERRRPPVGRLHIPTFEEFKRMRQKEGGVEGVKQDGRNDGKGNPAEAEPGHAEGPPAPQDGGTGVSEDVPDGRSGEKRVVDDPTGSEATVSESGGADGVAAPVCTSPAPRSCLDPQATGQEEPPGDLTWSPNADTAGVGAPHWRESCAPSSSCCPSLLLDGAKISRIRDGFFGSALDLIRKSLSPLSPGMGIQEGGEVLGERCTAEVVAEASAMLSRERDGDDVTAPRMSRQPAAVAIATAASGAETGDEPCGGGAATNCTRHTCSVSPPSSNQQPSSLGCRRSSLDVAYEAAESVRVQRACRLRPHFSDPMPTDGAKRKQLELKMAAAAAFLHRQQRTGSGSGKSRSETTVGAEDVALGVVAKTGQHRWSNVSSLSADSGVVGLSDEREEDEVHRQNHSATSEVERVDSGIGSGLARHWGPPGSSLRAWETRQPCPDCGQLDPAVGGSLCDRCLKLRTERKEAVLEFLNTEASYGEDLRIIKEEFYCPMRGAGLLTSEQLAVVFSNVQELIDVNEKFTERLQDAIDRAFDQGDEDLLTVCIGEIFLEFVNMLPAFQTYCLQQSSSVNMLNTLEKEKELLRIFLDVSQNDNTALRRMNLRSFLMAPLQRVTKYPLLLNRISKATAESHPDSGSLREAKRRVESHLEHINMKTKQEGAAWSLRSFRRDSRRNREAGTVEMREVSMKAVGWMRESTRFVMEGALQLSQPADGQWTKKGSKVLKFQNVQSVLMVRTRRATDAPPERGIQGRDPPEPVHDGVLVLIKDKSSGKFAVLREPIRLGNCVVSVDPDCDDTFELLDIPREAFVFRAADKSRTQQWFHQIKRYSCDLGPWRKRRNALPNIMINTNQNRS